jgi:hypothetical protein
MLTMATILGQVRALGAQVETPFVYNALPTADSIRLIDMKQTVLASIRKRKVHVSLVTVPLNGNTQYDALSYTWGDPSVPVALRSPKDRGKRYSGFDTTRNCKVWIDGRPVPVTKSLLRALLRLRQILANDIGIKIRYLWADGICINQDDIDEREAQVAQMSSIYKNAENVIVWLGEPDRYTSTLAKLMNRFQRSRTRSEYASKKLEEVTPEAVKPRDMEPTNWTSGLGDLFRDVFGYRPSDAEWRAMEYLLKRPWFSRVWVVQEIAMSQNTTIFCGKAAFKWTDLSQIVSFLCRAGRQHIFDHPSGNGLLAASYLARTRDAANSVGPGPELVDLIIAHRRSGATDPRDKIFALLGLASRDDAPFIAFANELVPDYSTSFQTIYIKFTRIMLRAYQDLQFLSHVESRHPASFSEEGVMPLPSWVPDFRAPLKPFPITLGRLRLRASRSFEWPMQPLQVETLESPFLGVGGFRLGSVEVSGLERPIEGISLPRDNHLSLLLGLLCVIERIPRSQRSLTERLV